MAGRTRRHTGNVRTMPDLIATYWTTSGPAEIHYGREWSTFDWRDRCDQAARVGYDGIGIWHADIEHQLETRSYAEIAKIAHDAGLTQFEVEFLMGFYLPEDSPEKAECDRMRPLIYEMAAALGAHHIKTGNLPPATVDVDHLAESLAGICAEAAERTDAKIGYEIIPSDPQVASLDAALDLVQRAGAPANLGIVIDTWHMAKLGITTDQLRELPADKIAFVEMSDGHFHNLDDFVYEVTCDRRLPGEGEFDIPGYLQAVQAAGYDGPYGAEILWEGLRAMPIEEAFERSFQTSAAQFGAGVA
jgi:sugar phosphate isomerase/epimerase